MSHEVLKQIILTPRHENATVSIETDRDYDEWFGHSMIASSETIMKWNSSAFDVRYELGPSEKKQKLIDAGFKPEKADKALDALGLK